MSGIGKKKRYFIGVVIVSLIERLNVLLSENWCGEEWLRGLRRIENVLRKGFVLIDLVSGLLMSQ